MKKTKFTAALLCLALTAGCAGAPKNGAEQSADTKKIIKVAVTKNNTAQGDYFDEGVKRACEDMSKKYKDSGFEIKCEFYDTEDTYESVSAVTSAIASDAEVTAIIGDDMPEICENQADIARKAGKMCIAPVWISDDMMTDYNDSFFYMCYSNRDMGRAVKAVADTMPELNFAVCANNGNIARYLQKEFINENADNVIDYCGMDELRVYFDNVVECWEKLGVNGVVLLRPDESTFDLLFRLKKRMPDLCIISDFGMDDQRLFKENSDVLKNIYFADGFFVDKAAENYKEYTKENGDFEDTWETHGYNVFCMIAETAVKYDTAKPYAIAARLHENGYEGIGETFNFTKDGRLVPEVFCCWDAGAEKEIKLPAEVPEGQSVK